MGRPDLEPYWKRTAPWRTAQAEQQGPGMDFELESDPEAMEETPETGHTSTKVFFPGKSMKTTLATTLMSKCSQQSQEKQALLAI